MKFIYLALTLGLLIACKSKQAPEEQAVENALSVATSSPSDSSYLALHTAINKLVEVRGYADSTVARNILASAHLASGANRPQDALTYYKKYMAHYADRPDQADKLSDVISLTEKSNQPELSQILYKSFVTRFPQDTRAAGYGEKIMAKDITIDSTLRYLGMNMMDTTFRLNEQMARMYIEGCELAAMADPKLALAPEHLHRAAETARTLRDIPRALEIYDWILSVFPDHPRGATSLFLKAFTYDNDLKDFQTAGKYYNEFLTKYPNNEFAESAKFLLDNLGKSEEELKKILEAKSKENIQ